jgi:hypothetical protein
MKAVINLLVVSVTLVYPINGLWERQPRPYTEDYGVDYTFPIHHKVSH